MRIVLPDHDLCVPELLVEVIDERVERVRHVTVAQVPGRHLGAVHLLVVLLGVAHEERVLLGEEQLVLGDPAVSAEVRLAAPAELDQLCHHFVLARDRRLEREGIAVCLPVHAEVVEARVPLHRALGFDRIDAIEVRHDRLHRGTEAVQVESDEPGTRRRMPVRSVPRACPLDELHDVRVAPHPGREAAEVAQRLLRVDIRRQPHHVPVDPVGVGEVTLDRYGIEAELVDEPAGDPARSR